MNKLAKEIENLIADPERWDRSFGVTITVLMKVPAVRMFAITLARDILQALAARGLLSDKAESHG